MKLRTKLILAFIMIILLPIVVVYMAATILSSRQFHNMSNSGYEISISNLFSSNAVQIINEMTSDAFENIKLQTVENPSSLDEEETLEQLNESLRQQYSFLILRKGDTCYYVGTEGLSDAFLDELPDYEGSDISHGTSYCTDLETGSNYLVKQQDFQNEEGTECSIFLVTALGLVLPQVRSVFVQVTLMLILMLLMLGMVMALWIYRAILRPLVKLQQATREIKNGNLDFELDVTEQDEIGQLCMDFEEMRQRLKESAEEKVQYDTENKVLISNISHDLRTPITAIKGYCEGIMDGVASSPEKMDKYIRTIYNKANDMDHLIDELTFYSKIDTNKIPYAFTKLDIGRYFDDCVEELSVELESKNMTLTYHNQVEPGTLVIADTEQLKRVVNNIVSNSLKYLDKPHGFLDIRMTDIGDFVQIDMKDNGKGIMQKDLPYIFDRFYRTDSSRNSAKGGSGIGLAIVKKIVEDHGGQIWATSKEGEGTTMHIVLRKYQEVLHE
jgi:signal transduction histidine kinase